MSSVSQKHLSVLLVLLSFPYVCDITYFLNMLLTISSLQCILTQGSGILGEQSNIPHKMGFACGLILHTFVLAFSMCAFYHIHPVVIIISYVYAKENIVPSLWNTKSSNKFSDHWILMFCLQSEWFDCCNLYLCAVRFSIIAGSLTCW